MTLISIRFALAGFFLLSFLLGTILPTVITSSVGTEVIDENLMKLAVETSKRMAVDIEKPLLEGSFGAASLLNYTVHRGFEVVTASSASNASFNRNINRLVYFNYFSDRMYGPWGFVLAEGVAYRNVYGYSPDFLLTHIEYNKMQYGVWEDWMDLDMFDHPAELRYVLFNASTLEAVPYIAPYNTSPPTNARWYANGLIWNLTRFLVTSSGNSGVPFWMDDLILADGIGSDVAVTLSTLTVSMPFSKTDGTPLAMLLLGQLPSQVTKILHASIPDVPGAVVVVMDKAGRIIAHSSDDFSVMTTFNETGGHVYKDCYTHIHHIACVKNYSDYRHGAIFAAARAAHEERKKSAPPSHDDRADRAVHVFEAEDPATGEVFMVSDFQLYADFSNFDTHGLVLLPRDHFVAEVEQRRTSAIIAVVILGIGGAVVTVFMLNVITSSIESFVEEMKDPFGSKKMELAIAKRKRKKQLRRKRDDEKSTPSDSSTTKDPSFHLEKEDATTTETAEKQQQQQKEAVGTAEGTEGLDDDDDDSAAADDDDDEEEDVGTGIGVLLWCLKLREVIELDRSFIEFREQIMELRSYFYMGTVASPLHFHRVTDSSSPTPSKSSDDSRNSRDDDQHPSKEDSSSSTSTDHAKHVDERKHKRKKRKRVKFFQDPAPPVIEMSKEERDQNEQQQQQQQSRPGDRTAPSDDDNIDTEDETSADDTDDDGTQQQQQQQAVGGRSGFSVLKLGRVATPALKRGTRQNRGAGARNHDDGTIVRYDLKRVMMAAVNIIGTHHIFEEGRRENADVVHHRKASERMLARTEFIVNQMQELIQKTGAYLVEFTGDRFLFCLHISHKKYHSRMARRFVQLLTDICASISQHKAQSDLNIGKNKNVAVTIGLAVGSVCILDMMRRSRGAAAVGCVDVMNENEHDDSNGNNNQTLSRPVMFVGPAVTEALAAERSVRALADARVGTPHAIGFSELTYGVCFF